MIELIKRQPLQALRRRFVAVVLLAGCLAMALFFGIPLAKTAWTSRPSAARCERRAAIGRIRLMWRRERVHEVLGRPLGTSPRFPNPQAGYACYDGFGLGRNDRSLSWDSWGNQLPEIWFLGVGYDSRERVVALRYSDACIVAVI